MSTSRVAVVTGANKGIGLAIVRNLALQYPRSVFNTGPLIIYLTARNTQRGETALKEIRNDQQLKRALALADHGGHTEVRYQPLDITDAESIDQFRKYLQTDHPAGIDILINNAARAMDGFNSTIAAETVRCNYTGTLALTEALIPLIRSNGRIVNVSSISGSLGNFSPSLRKRFRAAVSIPAVTALMDSFVAAVEAGTYRADGWPGSAYMASKAGVTALTRALATGFDSEGSSNNLGDAGKKILVNACCPGYINTDMTKGNGTGTPDEGAQTPVLLALRDVGAVSGGFWRQGRVAEW